MENVFSKSDRMSSDIKQGDGWWWLRSLWPEYKVTRWPWQERGSNFLDNSEIITQLVWIIGSYPVSFPEELLQCNAPIIKEIAKASMVTSSMLITAQHLVMKAMDEKW